MTDEVMYYITKMTQLRSLAIGKSLVDLGMEDIRTRHAYSMIFHGLKNLEELQMRQPMLPLLFLCNTGV